VNCGSEESLPDGSTNLGVAEAKQWPAKKPTMASLDAVVWHCQGVPSVRLSHSGCAAE
jgi:hypothetical protein